ncbi:unnamed protein product [Effrenium voratum]|nr:unnamed protein product [Effrenium voratum]
MKQEEKDQLRRMADALASTPLLDDAELGLDALLRFGNNNFAITDELFLTVGAGCFPTGAALNHCCRPNCLLAYELREGQPPLQAVRVMENVAAGEELAHSYVDLGLPRWQRQQQLEQAYGFQCRCVACSGPLPQIEHFLCSAAGSGAVLAGAGCPLPCAAADPSREAELARAEELRLQAAAEEDALQELQLAEVQDPRSLAAPAPYRGLRSPCCSTHGGHGSCELGSC